MAVHVNPKEGRLNIVETLPSEYCGYQSSARLAEQLLDSVADLYQVTFLSWREQPKDGVAYFLLKDDRPPFVDKVGGLAVLKPSGGRGRIRLGFTREPATGELIDTWAGSCPIVRREAAYRNAVQDINDDVMEEAQKSLRQYAAILVSLADRRALKRTGTSRPEQLLMHCARQTFPKAQFKHMRPSWLSGRNGKPLELDIYSHDLQIAIEVQGPHHTLPIHGDDRLASQQDRDRLKQELCKKNGVALLTVEATALIRRVLTLSPDAQSEWLIAMFQRAKEHGVYEWPESSNHF